jgi:hypothetical protein
LGGIAAVPLSDQPGRAHAINAACAHFSGDSPSGLFRKRATCPAAQAALLQPSPVRRPLSATEAGDCEGPGRDGLLTLAELERALAQCARGRAAGQDGLPYEFYSHCWQAAGPLLLAAVNEAFSSVADDALGPLLLGLICLVHKGKGRPLDHLSGFRPLTLLGADLKIVAKAVANRLQLPLDLLIDGCQTAFIAGRDISTGIFLAQALVEHLTATRHPLWSLVTDLASAYDCVDWGWLTSSMLAMGFKETGHVRWARLLHHGARSIVLLNGWPTPAFPLRGGLAQGSGASPLFWTVVLQPLIHQLNGLAAEGRINPPRLPDGTPAPITTFADDNAHPLSNPDADAPEVMRRYSDFKPASGVGPQLPKCGVHFLVPAPGLAAGAGEGAAPGDAAQVHAPSGLRIFDAAAGPPRCLGVPLTADLAAAQQAAFGGMPGRMAAAAAAWRLQQPDQLERVCVAKTALTSKLVYAATFVPMPPAAVKAAQLVARGFVAHSSHATEATPGGRGLFPREAVAALPLAEGGLAYSLVEPAARALACKRVVLAYGPCRLPVQGLTRFLLAQADAATGLASWPITLGGAGREVRAARDRLVAALPPFLAESARAVAEVGPARLVQPHDQSAYSVLAEPLFHNPLVARPAGEGRPAPLLLQPADLAGTPGASWRHLRDVHAALAGQGAPPGGAPAAATAAAADVVLAAIPACWAAHVRTLQLPPPEWGTAPMPLGPGGGGPGPREEMALRDPASPPAAADTEAWARRLFRVLPSGRLHPVCSASVLPAAPLPADVAADARALASGLAGAQWRAAAVVARPKLLAHWSAAEWEQAADPAGAPKPADLWCLGPWESLPLDPCVWGLGQAPLVAFSAAEARRRLALRLAASKLPGYVPGEGFWPALWPRPAAEAGPAGVGVGGLPELEARWEASFQTRRAPPPPDPEDDPEPGPGPAPYVPEAERAEAARAEAGLAAPWLARPVTQPTPPRASPAERRAARGAAAPPAPRPAGPRPRAVASLPAAGFAARLLAAAGAGPSAAEGLAGLAPGQAGVGPPVPRAGAADGGAPWAGAAGRDGQEGGAGARAVGQGAAAAAPPPIAAAGGDARGGADGPPAQAAAAGRPGLRGPGGAAVGGVAGAGAAAGSPAAGRAAHAGAGQPPAPAARGGGGGPGGAVGPAPGYRAPVPPARAAWRRLHLDPAHARPHRITCFRIMHGCLCVRALRLHVRADLAYKEGLCPVPDCRGGAGRLETLTHAFLDCPAAAPVIDWMLALWAAWTPGLPQPPRCPMLLLGDRPQQGWAPPRGMERLWERLRVATLGCIWATRCSAASFGDSASAEARARSSAGAVVDSLVGALRRDWLRVRQDVRFLSPAWVSSWFRGRNPALQLRRFRAEWCAGGALCSLADPGQQPPGGAAGNGGGVGGGPLDDALDDEEAGEELLREEEDWAWGWGPPAGGVEGALPRGGPGPGGGQGAGPGPAVGGGPGLAARPMQLELRVRLSRFGPVPIPGLPPRPGP